MTLHQNAWPPGGVEEAYVRSVLKQPSIIEWIEAGIPKPLKYFPKGHIKKGYALFETPDLAKTSQWKEYFIKSAQQT